jgi:gluconolactonase
MMKKPMQVLVEGLGHPEGPCVLPDGRVAFANSFRGEIGFWEPGGGSGTYAVTGGGPNACILGSDGDLYCTNMPTVGEWTAPDPRPPAIQRVSPDGEVEVVTTTADGRKLNAPNDLVFGPDGRLYFTDSGHWDPVGRPHRGYICVIEQDGSSHILEELDRDYPNGIVVEPDGTLVWVESYTRRLVRRLSAGRREVLRTLDEGHVPTDSKSISMEISGSPHLAREASMLWPATGLTSIFSRPAAYRPTASSLSARRIRGIQCPCGVASSGLTSVFSACPSIVAVSGVNLGGLNEARQSGSLGRGRLRIIVEAEFGPLEFVEGLAAEFNSSEISCFA